MQYRNRNNWVDTAGMNAGFSRANVRPNFNGEPILIGNESTLETIGYRRWDEIYLVRESCGIGVVAVLVSTLA